MTIASPTLKPYPEDNSNLSSPWESHDDLVPQEAPSWVERATAIVGEQSPDQALQDFGATPSVAWPQANLLHTVTPPPGPTSPTIQSPSSLSERFASSVPSSPPLQSLPDAPDCGQVRWLMRRRRARLIPQPAPGPHPPKRRKKRWNAAPRQATTTQTSSVPVT